MDIEITKELYYNIMQSQAALGKGERVQEIQKDMLKILFPDIKSGDQTLIEQATAQLTKDPGQKMRVRTSPNSAIKDENPLKKFNR